MKLSLVLENYAKQQINFVKGTLVDLKGIMVPQYYNLIFRNDNLKAAQSEFFDFKENLDSFLSMYSGHGKSGVHEDLSGWVQKHFVRPIDDRMIGRLSATLDDIDRYRFDHFVVVAQALYHEELRGKRI
jgi:hypothetical protein